MQFTARRSWFPYPCTWYGHVQIYITNYLGICHLLWKKKKNFFSTSTFKTSRVSTTSDHLRLPVNSYMSAGIAGDFGPVVDCVEEFHCWVYMWAFPGPASFPPKEHTCSWSRARAALHSAAHIWSGFRDFTAFCCCATVSSAGPHLGYLLHQHVDIVWLFWKCGRFSICTTRVCWVSFKLKRNENNSRSRKSVPDFMQMLHVSSAYICMHVCMHIDIHICI